jgi:predicted phage terminase large subunit-like protein
MELTSEILEGFTLAYLQSGYDEAKPIPDFHRKSWALYLSPAPQAAVAAPRGHAKSTALTHAYVLASVLFRKEDYCVLMSNTEELAIEHLGDITKELTENDDIIKDFGIASLPVNSKTEIVAQFKDGTQFRIIARGAEQKMRGRKWRGKRPGLIVGDDLEDDEQVESKDRRDKFRKKFFRAVKPSLRQGGKIRIHGTIMHEDALLARIMKSKEWETLFFKAHEGFDDFSNILWPEQWPEKELRRIRQLYIDQHDAPGYSQEYLNDPFDNSEAYLRSDDFIEATESDLESEKTIICGIDFAISKKESADRTSMTVGGKDAENKLIFLDQYVGRWDVNEIIEKMFFIQDVYAPEYFFVESGAIWIAIDTILRQEMLARDVFLNVVPVSPMKDKATKGRSLQKRMRAGACRFKKTADWYAPFEAELLRFTGTSDAVHDDQFDSAAIVARGADMIPALTKDRDDDEEVYYHRSVEYSGVSEITGY